jgi:hypothetical protein
MFFRRLDYVSPPITFYHKNYLSHSSILSGILSVVCFLLILTIAIYFTLEIALRKNPIVFYFKRYREDAGLIPMNSTGLFHFISLKTITEEYNNGGMDFRSFRIIGFDVHHSNYLNDDNLSQYDYWLYGYCNNDTDTIGISHLISFDYFQKSACIRKYFSSRDQKYYDTWDQKFRWPVLAKGTFNQHNQYYNLVFERCKEETIHLILGEGSHCRPDKEMKEILDINASIRLLFIDNFVDVLNYDNPITKYFDSVENSLQEGSCPVNHININPSIIKTNNGLVFDNENDEFSYAFEKNDVLSNPNEKKIYTIYCFWLGNRIEWYERSYKRIQDIISNIGGFYQFIVFMAIFLNRFYNSYIILFDTENLLNSSIYTEKYTLERSRKINARKIEEINKKYPKSDKILEKEVCNNDKSINKILNNTNMKNNTRSINEINISEVCTVNKTQKIKSTKKAKIVKKQSIIENFNKSMNTFWKFILFKCSIKKRKNNFDIYQNFRIKILSEEHLIRNHLNIYILLRLNKKKINYKKRYSYQLKDLIKLV